MAAGVAYFYARRDIDARRQEQVRTKSRPQEIKSWQDHIREYEETQAKSSTSGGTTGTAPPAGSTKGA